ncbi:MAG TPA: DUF4097 family beta strand repeat-containing protein [Terriglobales bacterium]|nr:DUF4097 family beta strand repeat-containing protein [Terriglobales bacterium]
MGKANFGLRIAAIALLATGALAADKRNEFKFNAASGSSVTVTNLHGAVTVKSGAGRQVLIVATTHSDQMAVEANQYGSRIDARTSGKAAGDAARVEYEVTVPADVDITVRGGSGSVRVERVRADVEVEADSGRVEVRDSSNGHVHVRTVDGPVNLFSLSNSHIEVTTVSGDVTLKAVTGPHLNVNAGKGSIYYDGDFGGSGEYILTNNSGNIEVTVPASAAISLKAHSIRGSVQNDLAGQEMPGMQAGAPRSLVGTSKAASSSVDLRSFSGKIRVKKQ